MPDADTVTLPDREGVKVVRQAFDDMHYTPVLAEFTGVVVAALDLAEYITRPEVQEAIRYALDYCGDANVEPLRPLLTSHKEPEDD